MHEEQAGEYRAVWNCYFERLDSNMPSYSGHFLDTHVLIEPQPSTCLTHSVRNSLLVSPSRASHLLLEGTYLLMPVGRTGYWSVGILSVRILSMIGTKYQGNWEQNCHRSQFGRGGKGSP